MHVDSTFFECLVILYCKYYELKILQCTIQHNIQSFQSLYSTYSWICLNSLVSFLHLSYQFAWECQRSFTKRIPGCSHLSYPERLSLLNLHTLEQRRLFADLIMCYNIIKDNNCIDSSTFFTFSNNKFSRGHPLKLSIPLTNTIPEIFFRQSCHPNLEFFASRNCYGPFHILF